MESIVYLSDTHGDQEILKKLKETFLPDNRPDYLILEGDIVTTPLFRTIQAYFYNHIKNPVVKLLKEKPDATDTEILNCPNRQDSKTVLEGYLQLKKFESELAEAPFLESSKEEIATDIRYIIKYMHYGLYTSNLPTACTIKLGSGLESNANELCSILDKFIKAGTSVHIIEGNQDARLPIDYVRGTFEAIPLPIKDRVFHAKSFFEKRGYKFYDGIAAFETEKTIQVLVAFDETIRAAEPNYKIDKNIKRFINTCRQSKKIVIMTVHGLLDTDVFGIGPVNLNEEGAMCLTGTRNIFNKIKPDRVAIGHFHDPHLNSQLMFFLHFDGSNKASSILYLPENTFFECKLE